MKKTSFLSCLLFLTTIAFPAFAEKAPAIEGDWKADAIADGVYVIHGPLEVPNPQNQGFMNNPGFVLTDAGVVVVDAGGSVQVGDMVLKQIAGITDKPVVAVFSTHIHGDHWLGNDAIKRKYPDVKIYAHQKTIDAIAGGAGDEWMVMAMRMTDNAVAGTEVVNATDAVDDGDSIEIGGLHFNIYHKGPAHTHTDIMIHVPEKRVMFLGDNASVNRLLRNEGSVKGNIRALDDAVMTKTDVFIPGHGPSGKESAAIYGDYLKAVYELVKVQYEEGYSDFEIKPLIVPDLKTYENWADFDRMIGKHINKIYFEIEEDAF